MRETAPLCRTTSATRAASPPAFADAGRCFSWWAFCASRCVSVLNRSVLVATALVLSVPAIDPQRPRGRIARRERLPSDLIDFVIGRELAPASPPAAIRDQVAEARGHASPPARGPSLLRFLMSRHDRPPPTRP